MPGLIGSGQAYKQQAIGGLNTAAGLEANREQQNKALKAQQDSAEKSEMGMGIGAGAAIGGVVGGAELGASMGAWGGPVGAGIGAVAGLLASEIF